MLIELSNIIKEEYFIIYYLTIYINVLLAFVSRGAKECREGKHIEFFCK